MDDLQSAVHWLQHRRFANVHSPQTYVSSPGYRLKCRPARSRVHVFLIAVGSSK
jgi:hypothetical protein